MSLGKKPGPVVSLNLDWKISPPRSETYYCFGGERIALLRERSSHCLCCYNNNRTHAMLNIMPVEKERERGRVVKTYSSNSVRVNFGNGSRSVAHSVFSQSAYLTN